VKVVLPHFCLCIFFFDLKICETSDYFGYGFVYRTVADELGGGELFARLSSEFLHSRNFIPEKNKKGDFIMRYEGV